MSPNPTNDLDNKDLIDIRDAVPALDLLAIRSLRRAGFQIIRQNSRAGGTGEPVQTQTPDWVSDERSSGTAA